MKIVTRCYGIQRTLVPCPVGGEGCGPCETGVSPHLVDGPVMPRNSVITDDGRRWLEAEPGQLAQIDPSREVWFGYAPARPAGHYASWQINGRPFLAALGELVPIYIYDGEETGDLTWQQRSALT